MDKIQRATEIHRTMTPHQMAMRIVEMEDESAAAIKAMNMAREAINEGTAKLEEYNAKLADYDKRITELQDALELAEEAVRAKQPPVAPDGWKLVPVNVTLPMQHAYFGVIDKNMQRVETDCRFGRYDSAKEAYRVMLAAAPKLGGE